MLFSENYGAMSFYYRVISEIPTNPARNDTVCVVYEEKDDIEGIIRGCSRCYSNGT